jgi:hypothetical protein
MLSPRLSIAATASIQPRNIVDVDLAPDAFPAARRIALQETVVVKALADRVCVTSTFLAENG